MFVNVVLCFREVTVHRLISKNTVEEAMLRCALAKLQLEQDVTGQSEGLEYSITCIINILLVFVRFVLTLFCDLCRFRRRQH